MPLPLPLALALPCAREACTLRVLQSLQLQDQIQIQPCARAQAKDTMMPPFSARTARGVVDRGRPHRSASASCRGRAIDPVSFCRRVNQE